jgi:hypothetical protein
VLHPVHLFHESAFLLLVSQLIGVNAFLSSTLESSNQCVFFFKQVFGYE